ncbi:MAG: phytoene/squalene synthase family protein [Cyclobacteriaceae bacterium]
MSIQLFNKTAFKNSELITKSYSTSFSLGIRTLDKSLHEPIYAIYGLVRYADEIVDTFHQHDKEALLDAFKKDTFQAIEAGISLNPVLQSFQLTVNEFDIDHDLINAFFRSMAMDLDNSSYDQGTYEEYIYGSAEVVGLMCLKVFCDGDQVEYDRLKFSAKKLGAAFQKVNFLRDLQSDFEDRGRIYFPGVDFQNFSKADKIKIEQDIQEDFNEALKGIKQLPIKARSGVYLAYVYYLGLFRKIRRLQPNNIMESRTRIPDLKKLMILIGVYFRTQLSLI